MKRYLMIFAALALLAVPMAAGAEGTWIPPELNWTPTPPARGTIDTTRLQEGLVKKGVITPQEAAQLAQPPVTAPTSQIREPAREPSASYLTTP
ncbi:MAG: hypothetical protein HYZ81_17880 [Nitrospinae bacterium]|nr:hypothetical protein [Nitrospinota bacterium]